MFDKFLIKNAKIQLKFFLVYIYSFFLCNLSIKWKINKIQSFIFTIWFEIFEKTSKFGWTIDWAFFVTFVFCVNEKNFFVSQKPIAQATDSYSECDKSHG